jgi:hypothetical protein
MYLLGCVLCQVDVQSASLLLPLAQAAIISAPIVFRNEIKRGIRRVRARVSDADAVQPAEAMSPEEPDATPAAFDNTSDLEERRP